MHEYFAGDLDGLFLWAEALGHGRTEQDRRRLLQTWQSLRPPPDGLIAAFEKWFTAYPPVN